MLVVTHIDTVSASTLDNLCSRVKMTVQERLAVLKVAGQEGRVLSVLDDGESLRVNCLLGDGVDLLREKLIYFAQNISVPWFEERLPRSFISVRKAVSKLVNRGQLYLSAAEWVALAKKHGMDREMLLVGTRFLHEIGVVRFFGNVSRLDASQSTATPSSSEATILDSTVYLSPHFMVSVMKGLIRHDRQALQDFFAESGQRQMLRRTNRFNATGKLHSELVPFLWPSTTKSESFWAWVREHSEREKELWPDDVVKSADELSKAVQLLVGFDLMVKPQGENEYLVPCALPPARTQVSAYAYADHEHLKLHSERTYCLALPPGAFQRIVVRVAGRVSWSDYSTDKAVFYLLGNVATLNTEKNSPLAELEENTLQDYGSVNLTVVLRWRSSSQKIHTIIADAVDFVEHFFPGLRRLNEKNHSSPSFSEPVQVHVLSANEELAILVANAVRTAAKSAEGLDLVVDWRVPALEACNVKIIRVLLLCFSADLPVSEQICNQSKAFVNAGNVRIVPIFLNKWDTAKLRTKLPKELKSFLKPGYKPFDLCELSLLRAQIEEIEAIELDHEEEKRREQYDSDLKQYKEDLAEWEMGEEQSSESEPEAPDEYKPKSKEERARLIRLATDSKMKNQAEKAAEAVRKGLLQGIISLLRDWRAQPEDRGTRKGVKGSSIAAQGVPFCTCGYNFDRHECLRILEQYDRLQGDASQENAIVDAPASASRSPATISCRKCEKKHEILDLIGRALSASRQIKVDCLRLESVAYR